MVVQEKNKMVITIHWRVPNKKLEQIIRLIDLPVIKPRKSVTKKMIQKLADEITTGMVKRFEEERKVSQ